MFRIFPFLRFIALFCTVLFSVDALAQLNSVDTLATDTESVLDGIALTVATIAVLIAGFLILFTQTSMRWIVGILIGGLLVGNAAEIASFATGIAVGGG